MATITTTLTNAGFPGTTLDSADFEGAVNRAGDALIARINAVFNSDPQIISHSASQIVFSAAGTTGVINGSLGGTNWTITSLSYNLPGGGSISATGSVTITQDGDLIGLGRVTSVSLVSPGLTLRVAGSVSVDADGDVTGSVSAVTVGVGGFLAAFQGQFTIDVNGNVDGTITALRLSDNLGNSVVASGLALDASDFQASVLSGGGLLAAFNNALAGNDVLTLNIAGGATVDAGNGNDRVTGGSAADALTGGAGNDTLSGLGGDDTLEGGAGNDTLTGGLGTDTAVLSGLEADYVFTRLTASVGGAVRVTNASTGESEVLNTMEVVRFGDLSSGLLTLDDLLVNSRSAFNDVYNGTAGADSFDGLAGNDTINGAAGNDTLIGGAGNDTIDGGAGEDVMTGGLGNDTYVVDSNQDQVIELAVLGSGTIDRVNTALASHTLALNVEQLVYTGSGEFEGMGNASANLLTGGAGNDMLNGGLGADTLVGGAGDDTFVIDNALDRVVELLGGGEDTIETARASLSLAAVNPTTLAPLYAHVDNLTYTGTGNFVGTGNTLANVLTGGIGNDSLNGGVGNDTLEGGAGNDSLTGGLGTEDTAVVSGVAADYVFTRLTATVVRATNSLTGEVDTLNAIEVLRFADNSTGLLTLDDLLVNSRSAFNDVYNGTAGADSFDGLAGNDTINGNDGGDTLIGGAGNDTLDGGAGEDVMTGGPGNDTYVVDSNQDQVNELAVLGSGTIDRVMTALASHTLALNVEQLVYTGSGAFEGTGNASANKLTGGAGNDSLFGLSGNDTLEGKEGDDRLDGGVGADVLIGGAGDDTFVIDNALDRVVELLGGGEDTIETARASLSLAAVNPTTLAPLYAHVDNLTYTGTGNFVGTGNTLANVLTGGIGNDSLNGGVGNDTLLGNAGNDSLSGVTGNDVLEGGDGNDTLNGGVGNDTLEGGAGNDVFVFNAAKLAANADTIVDFESGIDKLRLENAIFTTLGLPGALAAGAFVEGSVAADASDRLIYDSGSGALYYDADGTGASAMVLVATLQGAPALSFTDIVVS